MEIESIDFIEGLFEDMQHFGLVQTKAEFSERMLGKAASYLTSMRARDRNVPEDVIDHMRNALVEHIDVMETMIVASEANLSQQYARTAHSRALLEKIDRRRSAINPRTSLGPATSGFIAQVLRVAGLSRWRPQPVSTSVSPTLH